MDYINEIQTKLEQDQFDKEELLGLVKTAIQEEKEYGITKYQKKDSEVMKYKGIIKELGYDPEVHHSVDEFKNSLKQQTQTLSESDLKLKVLTDKVESFSNLYNQEKENREKAEKKSKQEHIRNKLSENLNDKLFASNAIIENIILRDELDILDGEIVSKEGKSFNDYLGIVLEQHKDAQKVSQRDGVPIKPKNTPLINNKDKSFAQQLADEIKLKRK